MPSLLTRLSLGAALLLSTPACAGPVSSLIYPAPRTPISLDGVPEGSRFVDVTTGDGLRLRGILAPGRSDRPLLLVFHGNASSAQTTLAWLAPLQQDGFAVLTASYRGYSGQPGRPSEAGLLADARAFLAAARAEGAGRSIWVVGHSLGGGVALALSRSEQFDVLVTIGTFSRLRDMAPRIGRALVPDEYRNLDAARLLGEPFYLIHGVRDGVVPWAQGEALHKAAAGKRAGSFVLRNSDHVPAAETLRPIFAAIEADLAGKPLPSLSGDIQAVRFGSAT